MAKTSTTSSCRKGDPKCASDSTRRKAIKQDQRTRKKRSKQKTHYKKRKPGKDIPTIPQEETISKTRASYDSGGSRKPAWASAANNVSAAKKTSQAAKNSIQSQMPGRATNINDRGTESMRNAPVSNTRSRRTGYTAVKREGDNFNVVNRDKYANMMDKGFKDEKGSMSKGESSSRSNPRATIDGVPLLSQKEKTKAKKAHNKKTRKYN